MEKVKLKNSVEVEGGQNAQRIVKEKKCPIFDDVYFPIMTKELKT